MTKRIRKSFFGDDHAATLVEFTLIAPFLFLLTFGIAEFGVIFYQFQSLNAATALAARMAATRGPVITGIPDCGVGVTGTAGTYCSQISGSKTWTPVTCAGNSSASNCNATLLARILQEMRLVYPQMQASNFSITYGPSGLGFVGLGKPVPTVTVTISGVTANFIALGAFGLSNITLPPFTTTLPAEDLSGA
ncbi:MAG: TadE family protein [Pseudomonadota bacterium]